MLAALTLISMLAYGGQAEVRGPSTLCFAYSRFILEAGETVEGVTFGIHGVSLEISGRLGRYRILENETMRTPADPGVLIRQEHTSSIYRSRTSSGYGFFVMAQDGEEERMLVVLEGEALSGGVSDTAIYDRVRIGLSPDQKCDHRYVYGL